jgi:hypothetical protein
MKPFLETAAAAQPFRPEAARRLGLRAFTTNLSLTRSGIETFMSSPRQVLQDVFDQLGPNEQAALALVYAAGRGGAIEEPVDYTAAGNEIIDRAGGTVAGTARALRSLTGDFLMNQANGPTENRCYTFRHPTLWEGFASWLPAQPHLLPVVLSGLSNADLLSVEGYRHQVIATDTPLGAGPLTWIEARHRAHARVEMRESWCPHVWGRGSSSFLSASVVGGV